MSEAKIDQQAIADRLGVSRSTVTRVLRHDPVSRISPETKRLIIDTARDMGYRSRRRRTGNIAFVVCGEVASAQQELHLATCEEAAKSDYRVFFVRLPELPSYIQISLHVNPLTSDGAILIGKFSPEIAAKLADVMPLVILDSEQGAPGVDRVTVDYVALGGVLTRRLIDSGHKHIAVIAQFPDDVRWAGPLEGFRQAMESAGMQADLSMVWYKAGKLYPVLLAEIMGRGPRPDGILALTTSDHAIILSTLMAMGINVPRDLSYIGWAYSYMAVLTTFPTLTCLEDIYQSVAGCALRRLLDRTEEPTLPAESFIAPVNLRIGETCINRKDPWKAIA